MQQAQMLTAREHLKTEAESAENEKESEDVESSVVLGAPRAIAGPGGPRRAVTGSSNWLAGCSTLGHQPRHA